MREIFRCAYKGCEATFEHPEDGDCAIATQEHGFVCKHLIDADWRETQVVVYTVVHSPHATRRKEVQSYGAWICPNHSKP